MGRSPNTSINVAAIIFATVVAPSSGRADEPPAEPVDGGEAQPADVAVPAGAPDLATEAPPAAPARSFENQAVTPASPPLDQDILAPQDIATLSQLSLEDLLAVPVWKITTASKREESSAAAPATVFVVTKEDIYLRGYSTLVDVLKDLPGMEITENVYAPIGTQVAVRGVVGNNKIIVLVNGMRVNPPGGDPMMIRSDFSVREAEQIEIVYGPGSTLYGQDAISAVINVKTKRTEAEHWIDIGAGAGYPWRYDTWLGMNRKVGEAEINGYMQYSDANLTNRKQAFPDEWKQYNANFGNTPGWYDVTKGDPKRWDRGFNGFLQLTQGKFSTQLWHRQSWRSTCEGRGGMLPCISENKWTDLATVADARYVFKLADDVSLSSTITFNRFHVPPESVFIVTTGTNWVSDHKYAMESSVTLEETLSAKIGKRLSLLGGFVYGYYDITPIGTVPANLNMSGDISAQAGTIDYYTTQGDPSSKVSVNKINNPVYQSVGAYAEGTLKVHDRVRLLLGMRIDKDERYDQISRSPRAALIVNPRSDLALKAIYTEAFIAPAPFYMFDVYVPWWINTVNLNLKPERARSFELNAEFRRENVLASVSGYYNTQRNLLLAGGTVSDAIMVNPAVYLSPDPAALPLSLQHDANGGNNVAYGGDFFGRVSMARNRATLWGSYGYVDSQMKNTKDGVEVKVGLPGLAHHNLRLGATFAILRDQLFANLSLWLRSSPQSLDQLGNMMVTPTTIAGTADRPYEVSLNLIYRIKAGFEAFTTLKNITNHRYATVYEATYSPGELFRGIAGLRFRN